MNISNNNKAIGAGTGKHAGFVIPSRWDDIIQPLMGYRLNSASSKLANNFSLKGIDVGDNTSIATDLDKLHFAYQVEHHYKLDGFAHPHLHWIQSQADVPNIWMRWRFWQNGKVAGSYTSEALLNNNFPYTSGTIMQISSPTAMIDFKTAVGGLLGVSDFMDVEITRDATNVSGLFAGADPVSGDVTFRAFDLHLQVDSAGSRQEYIK